MPTSGSTLSGASALENIHHLKTPGTGSSAMNAVPSKPRAARAGPLHFPASARMPKRRSRDGESWDKEIDSTDADQRPQPAGKAAPKWPP
jgi:hypothetical protein